MKRLAVVLIFLSGIFVSCTSENRVPGHVHFRIPANPTTLDPAHIVDVTGGVISAKIFDGLVRLDDKMSVSPGIAERWEISESGLAYTFHLGNSYKFSNGRIVTSDDFKYSFERVLNPKTRSPNTWVLERIKGAKAYMRGEAASVEGIKAVEEKTLEIILEEPFSPFLSMLTMPAAYVVPTEEVKRLGPDFPTHPIGSGPFVLTEWAHGSRLALGPNPHYFPKPKAGGIVYRVIPEDLTAVAEYETGNIDILAVPFPVYRRYRDSDKFSPLMSSAIGLNTYYIGLNCSRPPFDDPEIRRAVSMAIDRRKILEKLYDGWGDYATGPVPGALRQWDAPDEIKYNPSEARRIIKEKKPAPVEFYVTNDQTVVDSAEVVQSYLESAGLRVSIRQLEWSAFKQAVNNGEYGLFWLSWWADYPDPENFLYPLFHSRNIGPSGNRARYANPEADFLIEQGQRAKTVPERNLRYSEAERIIARDAPWVFLWHKTEYVITQPWVEGFKPQPVYSMDKGTSFRVKGK